MLCLLLVRVFVAAHFTDDPVEEALALVHRRVPTTTYLRVVKDKHAVIIEGYKRFSFLNGAKNKLEWSARLDRNSRQMTWQQEPVGSSLPKEVLNIDHVLDAHRLIVSKKIFLDDFVAFRMDEEPKTTTIYFANNRHLLYVHFDRNERAKSVRKGHH